MGGDGDGSSEGVMSRIQATRAKPFTERERARRPREGRLRDKTAEGDFGEVELMIPCTICSVAKL